MLRIHNVVLIGILMIFFGNRLARDADLNLTMLTITKFATGRVSNCPISDSLCMPITASSELELAARELEKISAGDSVLSYLAGLTWAFAGRNDHSEALWLGNPSPWIRLQRGKVYWTNGRWEDAALEWDDANIVESITFMAESSLDIRLGTGEEILRLALKLKAGSANSHTKRGMLAYEIGWYPEALGQFLTALTLEPSSGLYAFDVAGTYGTMGKQLEAIPYFELATRLSPNVANYHSFLALDLCRDLHDFSRAQTEYQIALSLPGLTFHPPDIKWLLDRGCH
jgi:tetratricopeptide (TPR) repeat protein